MPDQRITPKKIIRVKTILLLIFAGILLFTAGGWGGWNLRKSIYAPKDPLNTARAVREPGYKLINPLLLCDAPTQRQTAQLKPLAIKIRAYAASHTKDVSDFSVYFRDLTSASWIGINEDDSYDPASLLKVPLLIAYLKQAESDPGLLSSKLTYPGESATDNHGVEFYGLQKNAQYTVESLLTRMIVQSDNAAKNLLFSSINLDTLNEIFTDLGVQIISNPNSSYKISAKNYSLFFRLLYNSTYLSRSLSGKGLELLTRTDFKDGLVAGIAPGTVIAHKFGQYDAGPAQSGTNRTWELHDCGIIYHSPHPYLACVMTRGRDLTTLKKFIQGASQIIYDTVASGYKI